MSVKLHILTFAGCWFDHLTTPKIYIASIAPTLTGLQFHFDDCVSCLVALSEWYGHVETKIYLQIIGLPNNFVEYNTTQFPIKCQVDFAVWVRMDEMFCNNLSNYCLIVRIQKGRLGVRQDCRRPSNISSLSLGPNLVYIRYIVLILFVWWRIIIHHYYYSDIVEQRVLLP